MATLALSAFVAFATLSAQPSFVDASTLPAGQMYVQLGYMRSRASADVPAWALYTLRNAVGIGHSLELSTGVTYLPGDVVQPVALTPGAKWRVLSQERAGVSAALAGSAFASLARGSSPAAVPWGILFGVVDRTFTSTRSAASLGAYTLAGVRSPGETRAGLLASVSHQATSWAVLNVSFISGNNYFGALSPGVVLLQGQHSLWLGYIRGTNPHGNSGPALSWAVAR